MRPYYESGGITIYHADNRDVLPLLGAGCADLVLTDPPYAEETHAGARSLKAVDQPMIDFASLTANELRATFDAIGQLATAWVVSFMDWRHICRFEERPPEGLRFVRFGMWVKPNGAPQFTGDRPGQGWEGIAILHKLGGRMTWNGGGRNSVFVYPKLNEAHKTAKPLPLVKELVALFSEPGGLVVDPFMGSGTTLRAAKDLGRRAVGIEREERWCEHAAKRLSQEVLAL